jgi:GNAT superfamily N-acetyltransferase
MHIAEGENADEFDARRVYVNFKSGTELASMLNADRQEQFRAISKPGFHGIEYGFIVQGTDDEWDVHAILGISATRDPKKVAVGTIYVKLAYRNLGYGRTLLEQARKYIPADKLLTSSDNIGSMAVRNWCSVARKHKEIHLVNSRGKKVYADFSGSMPLLYDDASESYIRMDEDDNDYYFVWPK